ncbi:haloacid dehalogenase-like hydrolase family protein [Striga asiatica]|uniref:Haloacid dehalogenase-like hydrolase family protein n=1 Tax=Striga asiatica TaxID=4170 RepID=A0A5A7NYL4_STRAF|nr:haloacid dehalogenase-like hydrolase family protein [Striga asiatica]
MLSRISPLLRIPPSHPPSSMAARVLPRALPFVAALYSKPPSPSPPLRFHLKTASLFGRRRFISLVDNSGAAHRVAGRNVNVTAAARREYRKIRSRRSSAATRKSKEKELELSVNICLEEQLPEDPEIMDIAELMRLNVPMAMKLAFERLSTAEYSTRDAAISDVGCFQSVELSVLLCNDEFIQKLNKEWRGEDHATDVLSMSQHIPELKLPILMLGDIVISVETAARQAEERGHNLIDEIRILLLKSSNTPTPGVGTKIRGSLGEMGKARSFCEFDVHGLLHLLGFDHELSDEAEEEMENEEELILKGVGWKGKGLIQSAYDAEANGSPHTDCTGAIFRFLISQRKSHSQLSKDRKREGSLRFYKPKFSYIFCDMDGTLLNSKSQISLSTAVALKEALSRGVKVVIATGKTRPAVINIFKMVNLVGKDGIISEFSPGVFVQGLLVYGRQGREIFRRNLDVSICREALVYSCNHKIPIIAFSEGRCLTLFEHPLVEALHTVYHEPKAEIIPSVEQLLADIEIQVLLATMNWIFIVTVMSLKLTLDKQDSSEGVSGTLRPYWEEATQARASVVQAVPDMLEIVPLGTSKGNGVRILLDHLGVPPNEIMAIGDGENDVEMLELASLGVVLSNGSEKAKAVANVIGISNDEDGVADAIYRYAF